MLHLRVYGASAVLHEIGEDLDRSGAQRDARRGAAPRSRPPHRRDPAGACRFGAPACRRKWRDEDVALVRFDDVGPIRLRGRGSRLIWADVVGQATRNARPVARYLVFMVAAGVIAAFRVVEVNTILIVGAM